MLSRWFSLKDADGDTVLKMKGPFCICRCWNDIDFDVRPDHIAVILFVLMNCLFHATVIILVNTDMLTGELWEYCMHAQM